VGACSRWKRRFCPPTMNSSTVNLNQMKRKKKKGPGDAVLRIRARERVSGRGTSRKCRNRKRIRKGPAEGVKHRAPSVRGKADGTERLRGSTCGKKRPLQESRRQSFSFGKRRGEQSVFQFSEGIGGAKKEKAQRPLPWRLQLGAILVIFTLLTAKGILYGNCRQAGRGEKGARGRRDSVGRSLSGCLPRDQSRGNSNGDRVQESEYRRKLNNGAPQVLRLPGKKEGERKRGCPCKPDAPRKARLICSKT